MLPDGKGVNMLPIEGDAHFERDPTPDDLKVMGLQMAEHINAINIVSKLMEALKISGVKLKMRSGGPGRIIH